MRYIKTYENWFTNLFKDKEYSIWNSYLNDKLETNYGYNVLMSTAKDGDLKKFKNYFHKYVNKLNNISKDGKTVLYYVVTGDGDLYDKKEMIKILIDNVVDYTIMYDNKTFYDLINNNKLKMWFDKTYPEIVNEINIIKDTNKYNL